MKIGFIGQGWIGKNYADVFEKNKFSVVCYSLENEYKKNKDLLFGCSVVFIAVPTPTVNGTFDVSAVKSSLTLLAPGTTAVIKSTIIPGTTKKLQREFPNLFIFHSPEFLREAHAAYDSEFPERNIIGIPEESSAHRERAEKVLDILPFAPYSEIMGSTEAELVKYAGNCYLYQKVVFFNLLYDLSLSLNADYNVVRSAVVKDSRIPESHTKIFHASGHSPELQKRGAGGHCFIKDFEAYIQLYEETVPNNKESIKILKAVREKNYTYLRESKKDLDLLELVPKKTMKQKIISFLTKPNIPEIISLLVVCTLFLGIVIQKQGIHNIYNDTSVYINQILFFKGEQADLNLIKYHFFKPLYGILGILLYPALSLYSTIFAINVVLFFGLTISFYYLCRKLGFKEDLAFAGSAWIASGYPLLKYGLALLTDISGWFFTCLTILFFLLAREKNYSKGFLVLASLTGFLGSLSKETGVLGLVACGLMLIFESINKKTTQPLKALFVFSAPILTLQGVLFYLLTAYKKYSVADWISFNVTTNLTEQFHSVYYFIFTEGATFHLLWIYALAGCFYMIKEKFYKRPEVILTGTALSIGTMPALMWPLFYVRIFYIQYLVVLPLALIGLHFFSKQKSRSLYTTLVFLPILLSVILFEVAGNSSLFDLLTQAKDLLHI